MGLSLRYYLFDNENNIKRLYVPEFDRLQNGELTLPKYASSSVCLAEVILNLVDRKPERLVRVVGFKIHFDSRGSCQKSDEEQFDLTLKSIGFLMGSLMDDGNGPDDGNLVPADSMFTEKALNDRFRWEPTPDDINRLIDVIWPPQPPSSDKRKTHLRLIKG